MAKVVKKVTKTVKKVVAKAKKVVKKALSPKPKPKPKPKAKAKPKPKPKATPKTSKQSSNNAGLLNKFAKNLSNIGTSIGNALNSKNEKYIAPNAKDIASAVTGMLPIVGDIKDIQEAITGTDLMTGDQISKGGRIVTVVCAVIPGVSGKAGREVVEEAGERLAKGTGKLDWSIVSKKGETRLEHVAKHEVNDLTKPSHGVFYGDSANVTNNAWANRGSIKPITDNGVDIYHIPYGNAGYAGGYGGQLQNLNHVTVMTQEGTNKLITAYPGMGGKYTPSLLLP